jgi:hypothetical protein
MAAMTVMAVNRRNGNYYVQYGSHSCFIPPPVLIHIMANVEGVAPPDFSRTQTGRPASNKKGAQRPLITPLAELLINCKI